MTLQRCVNLSVGLSSERVVVSNVRALQVSRVVEYNADRSAEGNDYCSAEGDVEQRMQLKAESYTIVNFCDRRSVIGRVVGTLFLLCGFCLRSKCLLA